MGLLLRGLLGLAQRSETIEGRLLFSLSLSLFGTWFLVAPPKEPVGLWALSEDFKRPSDHLPRALQLGFMLKFGERWTGRGVWHGMLRITIDVRA